MFDLSAVRFRQLSGWLLFALLLAALDQWTKFLAAQYLPGQTQILTPFLQLIYAENTGAAFSFLADKQWARWFLAILSIGITIVLLVWLWRLPPLIERIGLSLLLGGAIGNVIDRLRLGYVIDFIDAHLGGYHWPAFNIADSVITIGATIVIWRLTFPPKINV